ncbi:MAG: hypothetical protein JOZ39_01405 [Chloroflexi bacterium]|nr:hypothetical protein [Chloroflexota bacterium]
MGPLEGIMVPRNFKYWFESVGDEPVHLLQVEGSDIPLKAFFDENSSFARMRDGRIRRVAG